MSTIIAVKSTASSLVISKQYENLLKWNECDLFWNIFSATGLQLNFFEWIFIYTEVLTSKFY